MAVDKTFLTELERLVDRLTEASETRQGQDSFEMKMSAAGRRYYDIKMYRKPGETTKEYMVRFDELNNELQRRMQQGE